MSINTIASPQQRRPPTLIEQNALSKHLGAGAAEQVLAMNNRSESAKVPSSRETNMALPEQRQPAWHLSRLTPVPGRRRQLRPGASRRYRKAWYARKTGSMTILIANLLIMAFLAARRPRAFHLMRTRNASLSRLLKKAHERMDIGQRDA